MNINIWSIKNSIFGVRFKNCGKVKFLPMTGLQQISPEYQKVTIFSV